MTEDGGSDPPGFDITNKLRNDYIAINGTICSLFFVLASHSVQLCLHQLFILRQKLREISHILSNILFEKGCIQSETLSKQLLLFQIWITKPVSITFGISAASSGCVPPGFSRRPTADSAAQQASLLVKMGNLKCCSGIGLARLLALAVALGVSAMSSSTRCGIFGALRTVVPRSKLEISTGQLDLRCRSFLFQLLVQISTSQSLSETPSPSPVRHRAAALACGADTPSIVPRREPCLSLSCSHSPRAVVIASWWRRYAICASRSVGFIIALNVARESLAMRRAPSLACMPV